jgi:outer membrane protein OmpA-like peptidoglycan-associated protein
MKPFRVREARRVIASAGLAMVGTLAAAHPSQAAEAEPLLQPTPLVLKDGRIANVSIHVVPFAPGRTELAAGPAGDLADLTRAVGTDCFLTAQVIGHINSSEVAEDDTLNAHRLARARADAVQASLIGGGLPAKAIASVWDWQFMVPEPRVTLWVFELTAGEDCEGRPLHGETVASAVPPAEQRTSEPERAIARALAPAERTAETTANPPAAPQVEAVPPVVEPPAARPEAEPAQVPQAAPSITQPVAAAEPQAVARAQPAEQHDQGTAIAATPQRAPKPPASDGKVESTPEGGLIITFATNSSYFPSGTTARLRELVAGIAADSGYEVTLQVAVSGTSKVVGAKSAAEAARYNKWLAERRLERVQTWLTKNAAGEALSIKPEYVGDDDSRRVTVRVAPVG